MYEVFCFLSYFAIMADILGVPCGPVWKNEWKTGSVWSHAEEKVIQLNPEYGYSDYLAKKKKSKKI